MCDRDRALARSRPRPVRPRDPRTHHGPSCALRTRAISDNRRAMTMRVLASTHRLSRCAPPRGHAQRNLPLWRSRSARSAETREVLVQLQRVGQMQAVQGDGLVCHTGLGGFDSHRLLEVSRALLWPSRVDVSWSTRWSSKPGHRVRFPLPARSNISCAPPIGGRSATASRSACMCRSRPRDRSGDVHPPQDVRSWRAAREIPARLVVAGMTSNGDPHRIRTTPGRAARSNPTARRLRSSPTSLARGARSAPLQRRRGTLRPLPVWRHTGIWDRSSAG